MVPPTRVPSLTPIPPTITPTAEPTQSIVQNSIRTPRTFAENPLNQSYVRIINASPDLMPISIDIQGLLVATGLTYPLITSSTGIEAGQYSVTVSTADNPTLLQQEITLVGTAAKILMITGTADAPNLSIFDDNREPLNQDEARVSFIHAIANGPAVSVQANDTTISTPLDFGQKSTPTVLSAGTTEFIFQNNEQGFLTHQVTLRSRRASTFVVLGTVEDPQVIEFGEAVSGSAQVRFIHAAPEVIAVDIYMDNQSVVNDFGFTRSTERSAFAAKTYNLNLFRAGETPDSGDPLLSTTINVLADQPISIVIAGTTDSPLAIRVVDNLSIIRPGLARISFLNPLAEYPNVNIAFSGGTVPGVPDFLGYGQVSPPAELESDTYTITWTDITIAGDGEIIERADNIELQSGRYYLYVVTALGEEETTPLIFSETVDVDQSLIDVPLDQEITPIPSSPTRFRFVNANDDALTVNIFVDTLEVSAALGYGAGTNYVVAPAGFQTITATNSETDATLASLDYEFSVATDYSIFIYGYELDEFRIAIVEDENPAFSQNNTSYLRMVNLSSDNSVVFQLGYSPSPEVRAPVASSTESLDPVRPAVPLGISRISGEVVAMTASIYSPVTAGNLDLLVIDPGANVIAGTFVDSSLEADTTYDFVIYQDLYSTRRIKGFLIAQSTP
ncbi:MAG: DUF4397 domain-containing protein [Aggregatilineales bacterium]